MCVKCFESSTCSRTYVLAGFEDGSIALWDCRNVRQEVSSLKLFSDPGSQPHVHYGSPVHPQVINTFLGLLF